MSTLNISCPVCAKQYKKIKIKLVGHKVKCECGKVFRIGQASDKVAQSPVRPDVVRPTAPSAGDLPVAKVNPIAEPELELIPDDAVHLVDDDFGFEPPQPSYSQPANPWNPAMKTPRSHRLRQKTADGPTIIHHLTIWFLVCVNILIFLIFTGCLLFQRTPTSEIPGNLRGEDYTNAYLARHPEFIGYFFLGLSLIAIVYGIIGLRTGVMYGKFGYKITGYYAKITAWGFIGMGVNMAIFGTGSIIKSFLAG